MGAGEYLSSKAHREYVLSEKRREKWQYKNNKETEVREMIRLFVRKGMPAVDAELVVKKMAEYEDFFVDLVVTQELGLQLSDEDEFGLIQDSAIMFLSFALCGAIPLFPFLLGPFDIISDTNMSYLSCGISVICLFLLGALKSSFR
jgi:vacuolar iron transporter family protein